MNTIRMVTRVVTRKTGATATATPTIPKPGEGVVIPGVGGAALPPSDEQKAQSSANQTILIAGGLAAAFLVGAVVLSERRGYRRAA